MDLRHALRTTAAIRHYLPEPVNDDVLRDVLDDARFAPSGGNRQAWHVVVVKSAATRLLIRDLYLDGWHDYIAHHLVGQTPFSPIASPQEREAAAAQRDAAIALSKPDGFAETLDQVPVMLALLADVSALAAVDRDLNRYTIAGGASIYPFAWNILLAARERGLGGVMTTIATRNEGPILEALGAPEHFALASILTLGYTDKEFSHLRRKGVDDFTTVDRLDGPTL